MFTTNNIHKLPFRNGGPNWRLKYTIPTTLRYALRDATILLGLLLLGGLATTATATKPKRKATAKPVDFDGNAATGSKGYVRLAALPDADLVRLFDSIKGAVRGAANNGLIVGHSLPTTHSEATDIGRKAARAKGFDLALPNVWSKTACLHSRPIGSTKPRYYKPDSNLRRWSYDVPTSRATGVGDVLLGCDTHGLNRKCEPECVQGMRLYSDAGSAKPKGKGKLLFEAVLGRSFGSATAKPKAKPKAKGKAKPKATAQQAETASNATIRAESAAKAADAAKAGN